MRHYSDSSVITIVIIINALIGFAQEIKASNALEKIKTLLSAETNVYRDGTRTQMLARNLVVGDVVYLEAGDNVPADLRLVDLDNLRIQESALTGESDSVAKTINPLPLNTPISDQTNMAFASTGVTNESGLGIVVAVGENTEIGKISTTVQDMKHQNSPLTKELDQLGAGISWFIIISSVILFVFGMFLQIYSIPVLVMAIITMIVGSMPEGLPALMQRPPRSKYQKLMNRHDVWQMIYVSLIIAGMALIAFSITERFHIPFFVTSTMAVNIIICGKIYYLFNIRTTAPAFSKRVILSNKMAYVSIFAMILLQLIFTYVPFMNGVFSTSGLSITQWIIVVVASLPVLLVSESNKAWRKKHQLPIL